ncbi:MAG TPA: type II toxin-antitoxin system RelE/ParE family toxin [Stellaceae bacterium]|nr:type II toxin-antitoxin system RelE/ParE family toxin [Stellaceae bacterium]
MKVVYARRAMTDIANIGADSRRLFGDSVSLALETTIRACVARIDLMPEIGQRVAQRPDVRVIPLVRYPFKIFYRVTDESVTVLHIRHASRQPWPGDQPR